ncbi:hypothetical protein BER93_18730 [Xanthomonas fragariae]|nr:hypothetical protein BER92_18680 [Xanthomonas fragariae]AOD19756.1 hypothetical protein BER93_18730 [Xanthomonas fragariae]
MVHSDDNNGDATLGNHTYAAQGSSGIDHTRPMLAPALCQRSAIAFNAFRLLPHLVAVYAAGLLPEARRA